MAWYSWSQTAASNATVDSSINWQEGQAPSTVNDSARAMMAATAKYRDDVNGSLTTAGILTAYTLATNSNYDSLAHLDKQTLTFVMHATSGATPTLAVDSLTAKPIRIATGATLATGALIIGSTYSVTYYNTAGEFLIHDQVAVAPLAANAVVTSNITDANVTYAKIQNVGASSLLGNPTGSGAVASEITLGGGLSFSGSTLVATLNPANAPGYLNGLTLSTAGSSATFGIAAGTANDSAAGGLMTLASAYTKTTSAWAVGTSNGGLDTSTIAINTWYHVFLIKRTDTGVVDVLFSASPTSPTMPTNYTLSRRIGSMKTNASSQWTAFAQTGDQFILSVSVADLNNLTSTAARVSTALSVPTGIVVDALFRGGVAGGGSGISTRFSSLLEADSASSLALGCSLIANISNTAAGIFSIVTNTSAQIGVRSDVTNGGVYINTYGWRDARGK